MKSKRNLQVKLAVDPGLESTWNLLQKEFQALDKPAIIRLALNTLAKEVRKQSPSYEILNLLEELRQNREGLSEEEFSDFWNKNKEYL